MISLQSLFVLELKNVKLGVYQIEQDSLSK